MDSTAIVRPLDITTPWGTVVCMSLTMFALIASEFMPVALLTPIAGDLGISEGQAGQAIAFSGFFAVITALFGNALLGQYDRRSVMLFYTAVLVVSGLAVTFAPNYLVLMFGRALIGMSIGGYISLTTAILARISAPADLPRALALLQSGSALASVLAQPLGSLLGGYIGWRAAFFVVVPLGVISFIWQMFVLPRVPATGGVSVAKTFGLLRERFFYVGMVAMMLFFVGQFSLSTYLRPYLELVTQLDINALSAVFLGIGLAGLAGTSAISFFLGQQLRTVMIGFPIVLAAIALALIGFSTSGFAVAGLLLLWGLLTTPMPVAWNAWMTRVVPDRLEAAGALFVALIQAAITFGAFAGGLLYDQAGWWSAFGFGAAAFVGATIVGVFAARSLSQ